MTKEANLEKWILRTNGAIISSDKMIFMLGDDWFEQAEKQGNVFDNMAEAIAERCRRDAKNEKQ